MSKPVNRSRRQAWIGLLLSSLVLIPAMYGFGTKFREFLALYTMEDGAFTLVPILNYLLASAGFLLLLLWAIAHGMFRDVERPKYTMLANERWIDEHTGNAEEPETPRQEESWRSSLPRTPWDER